MFHFINSFVKTPTEMLKIRRFVLQLIHCKVVDTKAFCFVTFLSNSLVHLLSRPKNVFFFKLLHYMEEQGIILEVLFSLQVACHKSRFSYIENRYFLNTEKSCLHYRKCVFGCRIHFHLQNAVILLIFKVVFKEFGYLTQYWQIVWFEI